MKMDYRKPPVIPDRARRIQITGTKVTQINSLLRRMKDCTTQELMAAMKGDYLLHWTTQIDVVEHDYSDLYEVAIKRKHVQLRSIKCIYQEDGTNSRHVNVIRKAELIDWHLALCFSPSPWIRSPADFEVYVTEGRRIKQYILGLKKEGKPCTETVLGLLQDGTPCEYPVGDAGAAGTDGLANTTNVTEVQREAK